MSWPSTMSGIDKLTRGAKSTAPQRILSGLRSSENQQEQGSNRRGVDLVPAQGVSAVKRELAAGFAWDRAPGVTALTAASLAAWGLLSATQPAPRKSLPPLADTSSGDYRDDGRYLNLDTCKF
jgi:hypothetical protein